MDVVSFETAKRLKEAGFPQPIARSGIHVCSPTGRLYLFNDNEDGGVGFVAGAALVRVIVSSQQDFFAPSPTDILKEFFDPEDDGPFLYWSGQDKCWVCDFDVYTFDHQNRAAAWLFIHENEDNI